MIQILKWRAPPICSFMNIRIIDRVNLAAPVSPYDIHQLSYAIWYIPYAYRLACKSIWYGLESQSRRTRMEYMDLVWIRSGPSLLPSVRLAVSLFGFISFIWRFLYFLVFKQTTKNRKQNNFLAKSWFFGCFRIKFSKNEKIFTWEKNEFP